MRLRKITYLLTILFLFSLSAYPQGNEGIDPNFVPQLTNVSANYSFADRMKLQPDNKLLVWGNIPDKLIRYNTDGTKDTLFNCSGCEPVDINSIAIQPHGKIIVAGNQAGSTKIVKVIRINAKEAFIRHFQTLWLQTRTIYQLN